MEFKDLKNNYEKLSKKYSLPRFSELDNNFEIGKIDRETDILLKSIRKIMMEKIVNSIGFIEMLLNPMNVPRMYLGYIRTMSIQDKNVLERIYLKLAELVVISLEREVDYNEEKEAELIKEILKVWGEIKPDFSKIMENIRKPNSKTENKKERSYFG